LNIRLDKKPTIEEALISSSIYKVEEDQNTSLTTKTMGMARKFFNEETSHRPSEEMYQALEDIALTLEKMVNEEAESNIYLSSLAPGIGKTQTICFFLNLLLKDGQYRSQGILIGLSTYDEIESYIERIDIKRSDIAVLTSDPKVNRLGNSDPKEAQVLFTTQQRMDLKLKQYDSFSTAHEFFYKGKPRQIRIWDESFLPGKTIVSNRDDLMFLIGALRKTYPELAEDLDKLLNIRLRKAEDGTVIKLPDLREKYDVELNELAGILNRQGKSTLEIERASNFWFLLGRPVSVKKDGAMGNTALRYEETMPDDITPLLVLDASGSCRTTYEEMAKYRRNIERLKSAHKDHSDLEIYHWITGGGKSSFRRRIAEYVEGIANTINKEPDKDWLVIVHKDMGLEEKIESLLLKEVDQNKVHFITWGNHRATNKYSHIDRVILAGTLYLPDSLHESLGRLASGKLPEHGEYPRESISRVADGELKHVILQGACRGAVRLCEGDKCKPCKIFIMGAKRSVKPELFQELFPKSSYHSWRPITRELTGKVKLAMDYLYKKLCGSNESKATFVSFNEVMKASGYMSIVEGKEKYDRANFNKNIRRHSEFQIVLAEAGLEETFREAKRNNGFTRFSWELLEVTCDS